MAYEIWQTHPSVTPAVAEMTWPTLSVEFMRHPRLGVAVEAYCTRCRAHFRSTDGHGSEGPACYIAEQFMAEATAHGPTETTTDAERRGRVVKMIALMIASRVNRVPCACGTEHCAARTAGTTSLTLTT